MKSAVSEVVNSFEANVESVYRLLTFDQSVLDFAIQLVEALHERLRERHDSPHMNGENILNALRTTRSHDSLRPQYEAIYNQCVVLLVAYFGVALESLFSSVVLQRVGKVGTSKVREEMKVSVDELHRLLQNPTGEFGELLIRKKDISFQDMKSIRRAFHDYLGCEMRRGEDMNDVIVAQGFRHAIVHTAGVVDERLAAQVSGAKPRRLKLGLKAGAPIRFTPEEIQQVGESMRSLIGELCQQLGVGS